MFLFTSHWSYGNKIYQKVIPKSFPPGFYTTVAFCSLYYFWPTLFLTKCNYWRFQHKLAFLTADIFASFGVLPLLHLRAYTLQDATVYTCSCLYSGNFIISTVKSRYSHCFNCLKLFNEDRQYPKNGRFWP